MFYCSPSGKDNSAAHVAALLHRLTQAERSARKKVLPPRSLLQVHTMKSTTLVSLMERRCYISGEVGAKSIHILSVCSNKRSPCSKTHWAWMRSWHQGKGNKMCSCGVGSISEADAEKRQMRWQARREETWGQLNPQNWQYVIYRHYCTERLQKQPFSISELHTHTTPGDVVHKYFACVQILLGTFFQYFGFILWKHRWDLYGGVCETN